VVAGAALLALYPLFELVSPWSSEAGDGVGGAVRLSALLIPIGLALIVSAPLRLVRVDPGVAHWRAAVGGLPAILAAGLLLAALSIPILPMSPFAGTPAAAVGPAVDASRQELIRNDLWSGIWTVTIDRKVTRQLTVGSSGREAAWSPDGKRIAFGDDTDLSVMRADGLGHVPLGSNRGAESWISWAPDSRRVAYMIPTQRDLSAAAAASDPPTPAPGGFGPLSPDGLAFGAGPQAQGGGEWDVWVVGVDGSAPVQLTDAPGIEGGPTWSPDGREIAYHSNHLGQSELWALSTEGGESRRLTDDPAEDLTAAWSPDGTRIAFTSDRGGDYELYSMATDGSDVRKVTDSEGQGWNPSWSPDGRTIAYLCTGPDPADVAEVCTVTLSTGLVREYTDDIRDAVWLSNQAWSADGKSLLWSARRLTPAQQASAAASSGIDDAFDAARLMLAIGALLTVVLIAWHRRVRATGMLGVVVVLPVFLVAVVFDELRSMPAILIAGVVLEVMNRTIRPWDQGEPFVVMATVAVGAAWVLAYFATLALSGDLRWSVELVAGVAILCMGLAALLVQPLLTRSQPESG
jgi:TolB protein